MALTVGRVKYYPRGGNGRRGDTEILATAAEGIGIFRDNGGVESFRAHGGSYSVSLGVRGGDGYGEGVYFTASADGVPDWVTTGTPDDAAAALTDSNRHRALLREITDDDPPGRRRRVDELAGRIATYKLAWRGGMLRFTLLPPNWARTRSSIASHTGTFRDLAWRVYNPPGSSNRGTWESAVVDRVITGPDDTCDPIEDALSTESPHVGDTWLHLKNSQHCMSKDSADKLQRRGMPHMIPGIDLPHV